MSATDVIEQIKQLPREEQRKVVAFVHAAEDAGKLDRPDAAVSDEFKRLADEMFKTNAEMFRKLAQ
jgi:hypothetical protein